MADIDVLLGIVGWEADGEYDPEKEYSKGKLVYSGGGSYLYRYPTPSTGTPLTTASHWQQIASQGTTGPSAYDAAVAGGYTGTEAEFNAANAGIEAAKDSALGAAETANEAAENAGTAAYRSMLWRKTASGNPVSVYPVPESPLYPKVSGSFVQDGTGDPSPSNIRPITPWLANGATANVKRTGKNLLDWSNPALYDTQPGTTIAFSGGIYTIVTNGAAYCGIVYSKAKNTHLFNALLGKIITFSADMKASENVTFAIGASPSTQQKSVTTSWQRFSYTGTLVDDGVRGFFLFHTTDLKAVTLNIKDLQIELGSVATPYEPYSGQEISLTAPQEIAEGWMDNESNGRVTWVKKVFDGTEGWAREAIDGGVYRMAYTSEYPIVYASSTSLAEIFCSHYPTKTSQQTYLRSVGVSRSNSMPPSSSIIYVYDATYNTDVNGFKSFLAAQYAAGTPVTVVYKLATPVDITPSAVPLTALSQVDRLTPRSNVLTASTGNIELAYAAQLAVGLLMPKGTYANLAALNAGTPTVADTNEIYITLDDGKWCYNNGTAWVAGGVFQAASVVDDIKYLNSKLSNLNQYSDGTLTDITSEYTIVQGFIVSTGGHNPYAASSCTDFVDIADIDGKYITCDIEPGGAVGYAIYDSTYTCLGSIQQALTDYRIFAYDIRVLYPTAKYIRISYIRYNNASGTPTIKEENVSGTVVTKIRGIEVDASPLHGKKYVSCGDSFTAGEFTGYTDFDGKTGTNSDAYSTEMACYKTYPYHIAKRNNMVYVQKAVNGGTIKTFYNSILTGVPTDSDYITIAYGLNDFSASMPIGTIDDNENDDTFYGYFNYCMTWLITNCTKAHIGIIIMPAYMGNAYRIAQEAIAAKYGIAVINLYTDKNAPLFMNKNGVDAAISSALYARYKVTDTNLHPNLDAHERISGCIENWMRGI